MSLAGVVLAGGASRRMGRNKALIDVAGRAIADRVLDAERGVGASPVMIVGGDPVELEALSAPVIADRYPGAGPVGGVLTALDHLSSSDSVTGVLILPCDLPAITADALTPLATAAADDGYRRTWVAVTDRLEPMCAVWPLDSRTLVDASFRSGERALHRVLSAVPHATIAIDRSALRNVNRPDDLRPDPADR